MAEGGNFRNRNGKRCTQPIPLLAGETVKVTTTGDGSYVMTPIVRVSGADAIIANSYHCTTLVSQSGSASSTYSYTATEDIYISVCGASDCVVSFENLQSESRIDKIEAKIGITVPYLSNKRIYTFGDSLTAASTSGIKGFADIIAEASGIKYRPFVYDSADGNTADIPYLNPALTNYAKDGTTNRIVSGRSDSVLERVKRHITINTDADIVLIECCVNDMSSDGIKGTIAETYTEDFNTATTIGAIEETCRYITTLGKPIRVGFFIPWQITWGSNEFFDNFADVFKKWGVPFLDLRYSAGFDMRHCVAHRIYSLSSDSYAEYSATQTYNLDDKVKYGGVLYKCKSDGVRGIEPTNTAYWQEVSSSTFDGTHLNTVGHKIVASKILSFIQSL